MIFIAVHYLIMALTYMTLLKFSSSGYWWWHLWLLIQDSLLYRMPLLTDGAQCNQPLVGNSPSFGCSFLLNPLTSLPLKRVVPSPFELCFPVLKQKMSAFARVFDKFKKSNSWHRWIIQVYRVKSYKLTHYSLLMWNTWECIFWVPWHPPCEGSYCTFQVALIC